MNYSGKTHNNNNLSKIKIMKKIILLTLVLWIGSIRVNGKIFGHDTESCYYVDGQWSEWEHQSAELKVSKDCIILYKYGNHPARFFCKINIGSYCGSDGGWYVYDGTIEYYVTDDCPNIKSIMYNKEWINPEEHNTSKGQTPCVKKIANAKIKKTIKEHRKDYYIGSNFWGTDKYYNDVSKYSYCYNIFFEGVGFGLLYYDWLRDNYGKLY